MQIYIHIPFCEKKCSYCRFASVGSTQEFLIEKYVRFLCKEITGHPQGGLLQSDSRGTPYEFPENKVEVSTIYFGGGTPGILTPEQLVQIFTSLRKKYLFSENIEVSLESTPNHVTQENIQAWQNLGVNRISMGIQTLNEESLEAIGRGGKGDIEKALDTLGHMVILSGQTSITSGQMAILSGQTHRSAPTGKILGENLCMSSTKIDPVGVNLCVHPVVSVDFILGLPHVGKGEILLDITYILEKYNFIQHISVYMLEDYYNEEKIVETKYDKKLYPENWDTLGIREEEYLGEYSSIKKYLETQGFERYEVSNFAKKAPYPDTKPHPNPLLKGEGIEQFQDYRCKHNWGYWNHKEVRAFGLGAYGFEESPHTNSTDETSPNLSLEESDSTEKRYTRYANSESFSAYYAGKRLLEEEVSQEELFTETVMFQLRTSGLTVNISEKLHQEKLEEFLRERFLEKKSDKIILLDKGVMVMDYILGELV